jgi:hypothetical protein
MIPSDDEERRVGVERLTGQAALQALTAKSNKKRA